MSLHTMNDKTRNILILNLMPNKEETEKQFMNRLSQSSIPINITLLTTASYQCKNTKRQHIEQYYNVFADIKERYFDGFIITGAPVERLDYEDVLYWDELTEIMDWATTHVASTLYICWGAQAGIYYHYGVAKKPLKEKLSGVYPHEIYKEGHSLFEGLKDNFPSPQSCYTTITREDVLNVDDLTILSESKETDVFIAASKDLKHIFLFGHPEYDLMRLDKEYQRDLAKEDCMPHIPCNYYPGDDVTKTPDYSWYKPASNFFTNWIQYYACLNEEYCPAVSYVRTHNDNLCLLASLQ